MAQATCPVDWCDREPTIRGYCKRCYYRLRARGELTVLTTEERFWLKVDKAGPLPTWAPFLGPCWLWTGAATRPPPLGHGRFYAGTKNGVVASRWSHEHHIGPIPDGYEEDHPCRVRLCAHPGHHEAVTPEENNARGMGPTALNARKTHCDKGHPLNADRACQVCRNETKKRWMDRHKDDPEFIARRRAREREQYHRRKESVDGR